LSKLGSVALAILGVVISGVGAVLWNSVITGTHNTYRLNQLEQRMSASEQDRAALRVHDDMDQENIYLLCRDNPHNVCRLK
jgi:hypothetical protein